jgi:hypothetical protein
MSAYSDSTFSVFVNTVFANYKRSTAIKGSPLTMKGRKIKVLELADADWGL